VTKKKSAARAAIDQAAVQKRASRLLEGEDPATTFPEDAAQWIRVYQELIGFKDRMLVRMKEDIRTVSKPAQKELRNEDVSEFEIQRGGYMKRMEFWQARQRELRGIDLDSDTRMLRHNGGRAVLTRRQFQLLSLLLSHPGQSFKAKQIARDAWKREDLSAEQVRSYLVQLRRVFTELGLNCQIVSNPRQGYSLVFEEEDAVA
jgi:two-component SAPR family response regulator